MAKAQPPGSPLGQAESEPALQAGPSDLAFHSDAASLQTEGVHMTCFALLIIFVLTAYISLL